MGRALVCDLYELNMAASYLRRGMRSSATFSLFVRDLPRERGFLVAAGIEDCLEYLETFAFASEDAEWLRSHGFSPQAVDELTAIRFTGDVHAVREGEVLLPQEPLLEVTAPLPEAQLVETFLLNQVTFQSAVATKAVRCKLAAGGIQLVDFALRRTHGVDAGVAVARATAMAGFAGTSNVEAARRFGLAPAGTMAHSYVEAFPTERDAFCSFVEDLHGPYTFLVDTYDTLSGVRVAADVVSRLGLGRKGEAVAIRLDSGDLAALASDARRILDDAGLHHVRIFVSGALDEYELEDLRAAGAPVDAAGVGTRLGVAADAPYFDSVYKLVELEGRPIAKLSTGKESLPGAKQVWRRSGRPDVLARREEAPYDGAEPLLVARMRGGKRLGDPDDLGEARRRIERGLASLPVDALRIRGPAAPVVEISAPLRALAAQTSAHLRRSVGL